MEERSLLSICEQEIPVPGLGYIVLLDWMGGDEAICQAARLSYGKGTRQVSDDRTLIRYLMRHRHTTPFEQCVIKLLIYLPMDCMRQLVRHRTARLNEYSTRYSEAIDECAITPPNAWRSQDPENKQGSGAFIHEAIGQRLSAHEADFQKEARRLYQTRIAAGVAREQARKDLPLSTFTKIVWQMDLHNLFHFLGLRLDAHAQLEIRLYAQAIAEIVKLWCPMAWEAFEDYRLKALTLTGPELAALAAAMSQREILASQGAFTATRTLRDEALHNLETSGASKREIAEFGGKLDRMRLINET